MSSLQTSLAQSRKTADADDAPACFAVSDGVGSVTFITWNHGTWVLPWIHLLAAHHSSAAETDRLALTFAQHEVTAEGLRLALLLPDIAGSRLSMLREFPETPT